MESETITTYYYELVFNQDIKDAEDNVVRAKDEVHETGLSFDYVDQFRKDNEGVVVLVDRELQAYPNNVVDVIEVVTHVTRSKY